MVWICLFGYFTYHIISGARGAVSWMKLNGEMASLEAELKTLRENNEFMDGKIKLMGDNNLDLDLLEEQAIGILGFANGNDIVVLLPRGD
jgi:cell division protein FtsB